MSKFMYIFREGERPNLSPTELGAHLAKWSAWVAALTESGHIQPGGAPLELRGKTLRGTSKTLTDGPYAEAKDLVTGIVFVSADSLEAATDLARACPIFHYGGCVEVRPIAGPPP